jgi:sugar phosphate isomerase/epimerase
LRRVAALGFRYVDLHGVFHAGPVHLSDKERAAIKPELDSLGLSPRNYILHPRHNPASAGDKEIDEDLAYLREGMDMASGWGVRQMMLNAGQWAAGIPRPDAWASSVRFLQRVCEVATRYEMQIAQEPEPYVWFLVNDLASACRMNADVDRPNFNVLVDLGHMGLARESRPDLERVADLIIHAHFSDHQLTKHTNQVIGTGATPITDLVSLLRGLDLDRRVGRFGFDELVISCELGVPGDVIPDPDDWARRSLRFVQSIAPDLRLN